MEPESYWYSTRPILEQSRRVHSLATDHRTTVALSADLVPDLVAPECLQVGSLSCQYSWLSNASMMSETSAFVSRTWGRSE